jgi:aspartyl-tRNA(Asn)/glutamyl-tRNA(Gln) amidotransferase subunit A
MYLMDIMTVAANLAGVPAVSVPAGEADGLPVGLQLISAQGKDRLLLSAAKAYEEIAA